MVLKLGQLRKILKILKRSAEEGRR